MGKKKYTQNTSEKHRIRAQQVIFIVFAAMIVISMVLSMVAAY
jgi:predicted nucleic acid-binding Zn ribbon protein